MRQKCLVIAYAVHETGRREVIGLDVGEAETEAFWREFLRALRARGLTGVRLCVSDCHEGLKHAIGQVLGARGSAARVHFLRNMLGHCRQEPAADGLGRDPRHLRRHRRRRSARAARRRRRAARAASRRRSRSCSKTPKPTCSAFYAFPREHWSKLRSTNPLERVNREIGRRSDVVGIFPNDAALIRLAGALLIEQNDEWLVARRYLSESSMALVAAHYQRRRDREDQ